jgi:hypothetical protein
MKTGSRNMKTLKRALVIVLATGLLSSGMNVFAHGTGTGDSMDGLMVTRHFTGAWDQVEHESQGLLLEVIEQLDDSRKSVAYWYTYGADRKSAWYLGIGDLDEDQIDFELYEPADVGFMQLEDPDNAPIHSIGTMTIIFDSCDTGVVTYATDHAELGSGSFDIARVSEVMNTHCTGGISDDMHADGMFGEQRIELRSAREGITGNGHARYEDFPGHMEFEVEVEGLPDGDYHLHVGMQDQGEFNVHESHGEMEFASPGETGKSMMTFDPRGMQIEVHDNGGAVLSSFEDMFKEDEHGHHGDGDGHHGDGDHNYDCDSGMGMGHGMGMGDGMADCVDDGEYIEIEADLVNTGVLPEAKGEAEWEMNSDRVMFSVEIEDVPVGSYSLVVGGNEVGIIEAFEMHNSEVYGHVTFRDPDTHGREHLDFEPRGEKIEVFQGENSILEVEFPAE